jgi:aromatic ring hydroxylase
MKLAWDVTGSEFGSRAGLYERLYPGDPEINYQGMRVARAVTAQAMTGTVS